MRVIAVKNQVYDSRIINAGTEFELKTKRHFNSGSMAKVPDQPRDAEEEEKPQGAEGDPGAASDEGQVAPPRTPPKAKAKAKAKASK